MRTTVDLPDEVHRQVSSIARDRRQSISLTLSQMIQAALTGETSTDLEVDPATGFPIVRVGRPITSDDVMAIDDE